MLIEGTALGPYRILGLLGTGGMGEVYRAHDTRLGRDVALKVIHARVSRDPERIKRFEQEARTAGALNHPNVCAIYDIGTHEGSPFVVMELLEGHSLRDLIRSGPLPVRNAIDYAAQVANGLAAAHDKGIVHRDLKPENLFVTTDGRAKVLDFGLAKLTRSEIIPARGEPTVSIAPTQTGAILGTVGYMAPEQVKGESADHRADLFALGAILYEMLTGRRAFRGTSYVETLHAILNEEPTPLETLRPEAPAQLARILRYCFAKDPERRVQTSRDVRNQLEDLQQELQHAATRPASRAAARPRLALRQFPLTAAHVRQLSARNPRLVGYPLVYLDNGIESDTLIVFLHGVGGDHRRFEPALGALPYRAVAPTLIGFEPGITNRPIVSMDDHSRILRFLLGELVRELRPRTTILVGFSAGADQFLRLVDTAEGPGIDVQGLLALGPNVSLETCFVSKLYAKLDTDNPDALVDVIKALAPSRSLPIWPVVQTYLAQTFSKLGSELAPLKSYAAEVIAPFAEPGETLAGWFRAARARIPCVRFVFSVVEAGPAEALVARHLDQNVLGDGFSETSFAMEPVHHVELTSPDLIARHVEAMREEIAARDPDLRA